MQHQLVAQQLSFKRQQSLLFERLSFSLSAGDLFLVEGSNGSGKSTLLKALVNLAKFTFGEVLWRDCKIDLPVSDYISKLHYVGHADGIKLRLTVLENIRLLAQLTASSHDIKQRSLLDVASVLTLLRLNQHQSTQVHYLSQGEKRRLALAKLFLVSKPIWILDEPLTALDSETQALFLTQLASHLKNNGMAIISTHHFSPFECFAFQRISLN
ncbi:MAG: cytochrome c biogenesis protein CcmA [uncultured bacterium]|nr:MAG: cytochrome c biogenesis protein CcmA [uncultured bacterium]OGT55268.1 MAG: heme ABC exporter, ATP-binding protein CcmA [Gammaproteobacteria bacterium RIFCSPHIGHO2_12_FULL_42_10]